MKNYDFSNFSINLSSRIGPIFVKTDFQSSYNWNDGSESNRQVNTLCHCQRSQSLFCVDLLLFPHLLSSVPKGYILINWTLVAVDSHWTWLCKWHRNSSQYKGYYRRESTTWSQTEEQSRGQRSQRSEIREVVKYRRPVPDISQTFSRLLPDIRPVSDIS